MIEGHAEEWRQENTKVFAFYNEAHIKSRKFHVHSEHAAIHSMSLVFWAKAFQAMFIDVYGLTTSSGQSCALCVQNQDCGEVL